jgi:hypothetical protein
MTATSPSAGEGAAGAKATPVSDAASASVQPLLHSHNFRMRGRYALAHFFYKRPSLIEIGPHLNGHEHV